MSALSERICTRFNRYKYSYKIGIDYGIDVNGRVWLIEVNFDLPSRAIFAKLPDKTFFHKIQKMNKAIVKRRRQRTG